MQSNVAVTKLYEPLWICMDLNVCRESAEVDTSGKPNESIPLLVRVVKRTKRTNENDLISLYQYP